MADIIKVSAAEMEATIGKYTTAREQMNSARETMNSALQNLESMWKGPAWVAMMAKWTSVHIKIEATDAAIARSINGLQQTIAAYNEGEEANVSKANSVEAGTALQTNFI